MLTRFRRLLATQYCNPSFMGHLLRYCSPCGTPQPLPPPWSWVPLVATFFDVYQIGSMTFKAFFIFFNVNLSVTGALLDHLDWLRRANEGQMMGFDSRIRAFRCLQILGIELNVFASPRVIPTLLLVGPLIQVYCTFILIKLGSLLPSQGFAVYPLVTTIITSSLIVYETFAAQLGSKSEEILRTWQQERGLGKRQRKEIEGLQCIRVRLEAGFIDRGTALVTQDMCINQIVSLLLM